MNTGATGVIRELQRKFDGHGQRRRFVFVSACEYPHWRERHPIVQIAKKTGDWYQKPAIESQTIPRMR
jgi:hypothetical protein